MVLAGVVSGQGNTQTVTAASSVEDWDVADNGVLFVTNGGATGTITLDTGTLNAESSGINIGSIIALDSNLTLTGVHISNNSGAGVKLAQNVGSSVDGSTLTATNSTISGLGSGLSLIGGNSVATLINTQVVATGETGNTPVSAGSGVALYGGALNILSGSAVTGFQNGISVEVDDRYSSSADVVINNSSVTGQNGSAIRVGNDGFSAPQLVNITVSNGATMSGGNGDILTVTGGSIASFSVSGSNLTGNITSEDNSTVDVDLSQSAHLTGVLSNVANLAVDNTSTLTLNGNSSVNSLSNNGTVNFSAGSAGRTLTVSGDYVGNNGLINFNGILAGDGSQVDRLQVNGDTSGITRVGVTNLGGRGDATVNGIELIGIAGNSNGIFTEAAPIVAGAYDYHLVRGTGENAGNWYLTSNLTEVTPPDDNGVKIFRPEGGAYAANRLAANTLFITSLADRQGETVYTDALTGKRKLTSMWMRNTGTHTRNNDSSGQLKTQMNSYTLMLGGDIATGEAQGGSSWRLGVLGGYADNRSTTSSSLAGRNAKGEVKGYTTGLYGTWYAQGNDRSGLYVDTVVQYSWFNNTVNGEGLNSEKYDADGMQASVEAGYVLLLGRSGNNTLYIQPNAQVGWSGVRADTHTESNGTVVSDKGDDNVRTRLGIKLFSDGHSKLDIGKNRSFRPFAEINWLYNTEQGGVSMDGVNVTTEGVKNIGEAKLGVQGSVTPALNITGAISQQLGDAGYSSTGVSVGLKYTF
uniref:autotransporter outer membrane beta-barrel domain-containing protein n=1 Tax=Yersinia frederiksenii TaxID=29484 RepID=UPI001F4BCF48|nr:autotransporter outer membrane beta-barrel domain-containing protein [Yersinia frederiksenii]